MNLTMKIIIFVGIVILSGVVASLVKILLSRFLGEVYGFWIGGVVRSFIVILTVATAAYVLFKK